MNNQAQERSPSLHLDVLEGAFGNLWKRFVKPKPGLELAPTGKFAEQAARFGDQAIALGAVASAFASRRVHVAPAERAGGEVCGVLLLPQFVALGADRTTNRNLLMVRAAISGHASQTPVPSDADEATLLARAVNSAATLARESHGFHQRLTQAAQLERATRPALSSLMPHQRALETLRQAALAALAEISSAAAIAPAFQTAWERFRQLDPESQRIPATRFWRRLLHAQPLEAYAPGSLLLLGGPLTRSERDTGSALSKELEAAGISQDAGEYDAPVRDHVHQTTLDEDPYKENMPSHSFEKIDFADEFEGGMRKLDGKDDMHEGQESLDGVDLRQMIRGGPEVESIYRAEIGDPGRIPDVDHVLPHERGILYDEWDQAQGQYRRDWVTLYPTELAASHAEFGLQLERELKATTRRCIAALEARRKERVQRTRQLDGNDVDLDGLIAEYADRKRGSSPPGRHYIHSPRLERDTATCVLLDVSLSADSWVENQRVLDMELAAACVLGNVAEALQENLAVMAFASNTRNRCRTWTLKGWQDSWTTARARLGAIRPQGYTRIGPAIRHATQALAEHSARRKHLILISDAKPTDFDRYEGGHGVHDVAWAVREARRHGVAVHAIGLDPRAAANLPVMFGPNGWQVLRHIADLPATLVRAFA